MGKYRKRFNEKARSGMLAKQAALKRARSHRSEQPDQPEQPEQIPEVTDTNSEILQPVTEQERQERKRILESTLYPETETKLSKSKKKRLDKYIEHQLKREEKKILMEKLSHTKIDTSNLSALKELGKGKLTKREQMIEALELEQQGRGDASTSEILYEEREVKDYQDLSEDEILNTFGVAHANYEDESEDEPEEEVRSTFVDNRPSKFGGMGSGFGFSDIPVIKKEAGKKKYSWKKRVEQEEKKRLKLEDDQDFDSSSEEEQEEESEQEEEESEQEEEQEDEEESENGSDEGSDEGSDDDSESDSEDSEDFEEEDMSNQPKLIQNKPKHSKIATTFKQWAEQQIKTLEGRDIDTSTPQVSSDIRLQYSQQTIRQEDLASDDENYIPINPNLTRQTISIDIDRPDTIQQQRMHLPVFAEEHRIMEAIHHHDVVIICGETGSGKTTQIPQFLYESGFGDVGNKMFPGMIGITQPRRVAAVSMSNRVSSELGNHGHRVGYQIRFDSTIKNEGEPDGTAMKFMTDGVLLREMMQDFLLLKYSCIIIDEAHERNINTDILIGMLTRVVKLRRKQYKPLKLVIMSATLRVSDFTENTMLFKTPPPIINVEARQYPVSVHFNKKTEFDYLEQAFNKTCKIHKKLPEGGILIFLTGQAEINTLVKRLRQEFPLKKKYDEEEIDVKLSDQVDHEVEDVEFSVDVKDENYDDYDDSDGEEEGFEEAVVQETTPLYVLPLYSLLPTKQQMKVFDTPPKGSRLCIVSTNVAETSLTIPGIKYVVDCGRAKERKYNQETGVQSFEIDWISKASSDQRSGRAGRTGPGHCYRLYSSAVYEEFFMKFTVPEILRMPFESIVLTMKSMGIDNINNFPFPTPPNRSSLVQAEELLIVLGALDKASKTITELGKKMALFPLSPRFSKILIMGNQQDCLGYIIAIVSALSVGDPFITEQELFTDKSEEQTRELRSKFNKSRALFSRLDSSSDVLSLLSVVCAFDHVSQDNIDQFVRDNFLRFKIIEEIQKLRKQIENLTSVTSSDKLSVPSKSQVSAIKQMVGSGFIDQIAIRGDLINSEVKITNKMNIINIPYCPIIPHEPLIYIHANSIINKRGELPPSYLVYQTLSKKANSDENVKVRMKPLVDISGKQLCNIAKNCKLLTYSKPLGNPYAPKLLSPNKRECYVIPRFGAVIGSGGVGWDLPVIKVVQEKKNGVWVNS
ncbi:putative ATP-dependent RNA helicase DHR1 [Spathaspora sp. JA1]|nr:putative ATP-dependent RNA helicase DHR1 [Spathaspora sp. JA1]